MSEILLSDYLGVIGGINVSDTTAVASDVASGKYFYNASGVKTVGTSVTMSTSDANATAGDLISGKTAYVNGVKITGTITSKAAQTYTPGTSTQTIAAGKYLSGAQTIAGSPNLIPENIASGVTIFGVTGTFTSDADATASDMLLGKTAYVNGVKVTGSGVETPGGMFVAFNPDKIKYGFQIGATIGNFTGDANAVASDIVLGKTAYVKGEKITGSLVCVDTSDANAAAEDIISGKTAYVNGVKVTGTLDGYLSVSDTTAIADDVAQGKYFYCSGD